MSLKDEKSLVVYFSRKGENLFNGSLKNLEEGNTKQIAEFVREYTSSDIFEIIPYEDYPFSYKECLTRSKEELESDIRPKIKNELDSIDDYKVIYICYPIWHQKMPMIMKTFLEKYNFEGKIIVPFATHEGSGFAESIYDVYGACIGADVYNGMAIKGCFASFAKDDIIDWINKILKY